VSDKSLLSIEQILTLLAKTAPHITELTAHLVPAKLQGGSGADEWSANDVLAHLRSCADVWGNCMMEIVAHKMPTIRAVNPATWIKSTDYPEQKFLSSLGSFSGQRTGLLAFLAPLSPNEWSRTATVTGAGAPLILSLHSYAHRLARHERTHVKQIERMADAVRK
jgi:DinB superfamily